MQKQIEQGVRMKIFKAKKLNKDSDNWGIFIENGKGDDRNFLENGRSSIINLTKDEAQIIAQKLSNVVEEYTD